VEKNKIALKIEIDPSPRKSNSREIVTMGKVCRACGRRRGRPRLIKSKKARRFVSDFVDRIQRDLPKGDGPYIKGYFHMTILMYYPTRRPDLSVELVQDALEDAGVIENDRYLVSVRSEKHIDAENPRVELYLEEVEWDYAEPAKKPKLCATCGVELENRRRKYCDDCKLRKG
jgi:Holliday junction resolvase RusA-like endonuclease